MTKAKPQWKIDYEESGQYAKDFSKAESFGHSKGSIGTSYSHAKHEEKWLKKLDTNLFLPKIKVEKKEQKAKVPWKVEYEASGQYEKDLEKAKAFGHNGRSFSSTYWRTIHKEVWQQKLVDKFFLAKVEEENKEPKVKEAWKVEYEESGQYAKDRDKSKSLGHKAKSFSNTYGQSHSKEVWQKRLETKWLLPKVEKEKKVKEAWKVKYEESGQYAKDKEIAKGLGHTYWSFGATCRQTKILKEWQGKLDTKFFLPNIHAFLETWDGQLTSLFTFIQRLGFVATKKTRLISELWDEIIDWLQELGRHTGNLIETLQSVEVRDQMLAIKKRVASVA